MIVSASVLALLCLVASGLLDLVFKLYTGQKRSIGLLIFGVGCVWLVLHSLYLYTLDVTPVFNQHGLRFGILAAVCVTASNILLLVCLGHMPISTASTIYRLNTIPLVIMAVLFLGEHLSWGKSAGVLAGIITVLLLYHSGGGDHLDRSKIRIYTGLIVLAACIRALYGVFTKAGISHGADPNTMMLLAAVGWILGGLLYAGWRERNRHVTFQLAAYALAAGALVFAVVWLLTTALTLGDASVVVPIANMGFIAAFVFSLLFRLEVLTRRKACAILCAMVSVALLTSAA